MKAEFKLDDTAPRNDGNQILLHSAKGVDTDINELDIWRAFKGGSPVAYRHIYEQNVDDLYKYGISLGGDKEVVLDCIQDLFIEVWQKRNKLGEVTKIKNYFFVSFRRKLLRMLKREKKSLSIFSSSHFEVLINKSIEEEVMDERIHGLPSVLRKLSKSKLEAINLRFFHGYTCEDIAIIMGINKQSVYNKISSALKVLKHHLTK